MSRSPSLKYSQERPRSYDAQPWQSLRAALLPARTRTIIVTSQVEQVVRFFHCMRSDGSRRLAAHILPVKQSSQTVAYRLIHHPHRPFASASSDGSKTTGKAFVDGQNLFARVSKND